MLFHLLFQPRMTKRPNLLRRLRLMCKTISVSAILSSRSLIERSRAKTLDIFPNISFNSRIFRDLIEKSGAWGLSEVSRIFII